MKFGVDIISIASPQTQPHEELYEEMLKETLADEMA
jgi:hypothetical protein